MFETLLETISTFIDGILNALGGYHWLFERRYIMPVLFALISSIIIGLHAHTFKFWWVFFLPLPVIGTLTLPYINSKNSGRALWLFIQAIAMGLGLTLFHYISWFIFLGYIILAGILGGIYKNWKQVIGDFISGSYLGCLIFFIK